MGLPIGEGREIRDNFDMDEIEKISKKDTTPLKRVIAETKRTLSYDDKDKRWWEEPKRHSFEKKKSNSLSNGVNAAYNSSATSSDESPPLKESPSLKETTSSSTTSTSTREPTARESRVLKFLSKPETQLSRQEKEEEEGETTMQKKKKN
jgi:hypothetical protein